MKCPPLVFALAFLLPAVVAPARAQDAGGTAGAIEIHDPWLRATPKGAPVVGGYATITNRGTSVDRVIGARLPIAADAAVHAMTSVDGVMHMAGVAGGLPIAPGATVTLAPDGTHLMFTQPTEQLREGMSVRGAILFERAGAVPVTFVVGGMAARFAPSDVKSAPGKARP